MPIYNVKRKENIMGDITNNLTSFYTNALKNKNSYSQEYILSIKKYDTDNNGVIDANELNVYVQEYMQAHSTESLTQNAAKNKIYREIQAYSITKNDTTESGLNKVLNNAPIYNQGLVNSIKAYDTDGDGKLSDTEIANSGFSTTELENRFTSLGLITNDEGTYNNEASKFKTASIQNAAEIAFSYKLQNPNATETDTVNYVKAQVQTVAPALSSSDLDMIANLGTQKAQVTKAALDIANSLVTNGNKDAALITNAIKAQYPEATNILSDEEILHIANVAVTNAPASDTAQVQKARTIADTPLTNQGVRTATPRQLGLPFEKYHKSYDTPITQYNYQGQWYNVGEEFTIRGTETPAVDNVNKRDPRTIDQYDQMRYVKKGQFDANGNLTIYDAPQYGIVDSIKETKQGITKFVTWHDVGESFTITDGNKKWTNCSFDANGTLSKSGAQFSYNGNWYRAGQEFTISSERDGDYIVTKKGKFNYSGTLTENTTKTYKPLREPGNGRDAQR